MAKSKRNRANRKNNMNTEFARENMVDKEETKRESKEYTREEELE